ncbi:MAG: hypothetical protein ACRDJU_09690 [Actinomycetota bacterium]
MGSVVVYGPAGGGGGVLAGLLWLGLFAAFIALVAWAVMSMFDRDHRTGGAGALAVAPAYAEDEALVAARARYAGGEIDREQYFQVVEDLTGVPRPSTSATPGPETAEPLPPE